MTPVSTPVPSRDDAALVAAACRRIEQAETPPALQTLAQVAGLPPHRFHRLFKAVTGLTPRAYAQALRRQRVQAALGKPATNVLQAALDAGFNASSRFYANAPALLGMSPGRFRAGAPGCASSSRWGSARSARCWWRAARAACARSPWARIRKRCCANCSSASRERS
ncbi:helix-turn-helix domain-containing protein [Thermomonas sp.]|uniref:helix-turn-helix domain-containing protein n=1 Tax=Thermomonas sp. TaxID=1971895 RepID=UPI003D122FF6